MILRPLRLEIRWRFVVAARGALPWERLLPWEIRATPKVGGGFPATPLGAVVVKACFVWPWMGLAWSLGRCSGARRAARRRSFQPDANVVKAPARAVPLLGFHALACSGAPDTL